MTEFESWFNNPDVRPYVLVRESNLPKFPGRVHDFQFAEPILKDPFFQEEVPFANQILKLENKCFQKSGMILPRWAYYDCSLMPGFAVGFAYRRETLPKNISDNVEIDKSLEFIPISLFIAIPTNESGHWVAHNLCSINSILPHEDRFSCLGFLTKAFGLCYFNIENLYGMTQWGNQAIKVHVNYGDLQVISSYTDIHDYPETLTYLVKVDVKRWEMFLKDQPNGQKRSPTIYVVDPKDKTTMKRLQTALENGEGPFYLRSDDFLKNEVGSTVKIYR